MFRRFGRANAGEADDERRAATFALAGCFDRTAMQLDEVPHEREPQAQAAVGARQRAVLLTEAIEHVGHELGTNADAGIGDADPCSGFVHAKANVHAAATRSKLRSVAHEIPNDLLQPVGIAVDDTWP